MAKATTPAGVQPGAFDRLRRWLEKNTNVLLLLPAGIIFLLLTVFPLFYNVYISFFEYAFIQDIFEFAGMDNYRDLIGDQIFITAIKNTLRFVVLATVVEVCLGVGLAVLFNAKLFAKRFLLPLVTLPMMVPTMVVTAI
ncbi:MAG TPA: hypothetical protein DDW87_11425, partial [Firmicutes bacterium]|nr:hypothetical protein [Bacillota bacterium]